MPGMNMKKAAQMMKRMGIQQVEVPASEVIIRCPDKEIVINNPQVSKVNMMGQHTYQIIGKEEERPLSKQPEINEEDIETIMEKTGVSREVAEREIKNKDGDLAAAILALNEKKA